MVALRQPDGTRHVIILKVSLGVCTLIKQENGFCGPSRENERKGELNYRPSPLHKPCISCFIACQKNPAPVDGRICNCARVRRAGGGCTGREPKLVCHRPRDSFCVCLGLLVFQRQGEGDKRKLRERTSFVCILGELPKGLVYRGFIYYSNYPAYLPYLLLLVKKNGANSSNEDNEALLYLCHLL